MSVVFTESAVIIKESFKARSSNTLRVINVIFQKKKPFPKIVFPTP